MDITGIIDNADIVGPCIDLCMDIAVMYIDLCIMRVCGVDFCLDIMHSIDIVDMDIIEIRDFMDGIDKTEILGAEDNVRSMDMIDSIGNL